MSADRKGFNLKSIIAGLIGTSIGLLLVITAEAVDRNSHPVVYSILASLAATLLTGSLLGLAYEFLLRRELLEQFDQSIADVQASIIRLRSDIDDRMRLANSLTTVGLKSVNPRESHFDYTAMITSSKTLFFVFNDGRTWFSNHHDDLSARASNPEAETHIVLVHPDSLFVAALAEKVDQTPSELKSKINESTKIISRIDWNDHQISICGHFFPTSYSLIMNDHQAVYIPYPIARKADRIPCFVFTADAADGFYHLLRRDVKALMEAPETRNLYPSQLPI